MVGIIPYGALHIRQIVCVNKHTIGFHCGSAEVTQTINLHFDHIAVIALRNRQAAVYSFDVTRGIRPLRSLP